MNISWDHFVADDDTIEPEPIVFSKQQRVEQFVKTMQSFEAFNLKQKYELGRTIAHIIHNMKMEKAGGTIKKSKKKYEEDATVEPDVIDVNPEGSWRTAEEYIAAYKKNGWSAIETELRTQPVYVRSKVLIRAIADEEVALVKRLVTNKYSVINIEKYNHAVRNYKERGTEHCEAIIDFIEKGNPELGAAFSQKDKLLAGWDQVKVYEYIQDNNYPMLRRALDDGFDPNFVYADSGSLLALSVVNRCHRCVKMLVERNVDVNEPILLDEAVRVKGWDQMAAINGWTPLMFAVADGHVKIVEVLIESGTALVSKTGNGQEGPRFHARAVARKIENEKLRSEILGILHPSSSETNEIKKLVIDDKFIDIVKSGDSAKLDAIFLLKHLNLFDYPTKINLAKSELTQSIKAMLDSEGINFN